MRVLINRIEIHQDKQVDLLFNFKKLNNIELFEKFEQFKKENFKKSKTKFSYSKNSNNCLPWNQPEGISMAVPMKNGGIKASKVVYYVILSGITTGIGAFFGAVAGNISKGIIAICLSLAAGAMIYIVSGELVPESNKLYSGRTTALGSIIGLIIRNYSNVICIIIHK